MSTALTYAVVTPVRDEADNVRRLAACLAAQTCLPTTWLVVDDGSSDGTADVVAELAAEHPWIRLDASGGSTLARGAPIVRAFHAALALLEPLPDVVVKLDGDISVDADHFERVLDRLERDPQLGIAGGSCFERDGGGVWRQRHGTSPPVWGACRAYRRECLRDILPLEERMGWDTLDQVKANVHGWKTEVLLDLPFRHHRTEGVRDGSRLRTSLIQGEAAHFMGYRVSYLLVRTLYRALRNPAAVGLLIGYARARVERRPRCADPELRAYVRRQQSFGNFPLRVREALRARAVLGDGTR